MRRTLCTTLAAAALALAACGDDDKGGGGESGGGDRAYPEEVRNNFLTTCDDQPGAKRAACECALEEIEKRYTIEEFKKMEESGNLKPFEEIGRECGRKTA